MTLSCTVRYMRLEDIPRVVQIDRAAFPTPWSASTYRFEITNRSSSHMVALEAHQTGFSMNDGWRGWLKRLISPTPLAGLVIGYGGCWLITGEAHISTIAVDPTYQGHGLGELLLAVMLQRSINLGAEYSVLEVRESNATAQALYRKYEYTVVGRRRGYYRNDGEDALLMEARPLDNAYQQRLSERIEALHRRNKFTDEFTFVDLQARSHERE